MKKTKRTLAAVLSATLALSLGIGVWHFTPQVTPSAEDDEIESVQMIVGDLPPVDLDAEVYDITISAGVEIDEKIEETYAFNVDSPMEGTVSIASRDWTTYDDEYCLSKMSSAEADFYHRLESAAVKYITDSSLDAYYMSSHDIYVTEGINYNDLGLSKKQAIGLTQWFIYNNPQYYFYRTKFLVSDVSIYMGCYSIFVDGDDRANNTNRLFNTVDSWVASINDDEVTTYQKVKSAHDLLCRELTYGTGTYDQSIYSTIAERRTVCAGYSGMLNLMLNASGIHSTVGTSSSHAWNLVQLDDGKYYGVDSTWDDTLGSNRLLMVGQTNLKRYDSKGTEHVYIYPWTEFAPVCASSDYDPSYYDKNGEEETVITVCKPYGFELSFEGMTALVTWKSDDAEGYEYSYNNGSMRGMITSDGMKLKNTSAGNTYTLDVTAYKTVSGTKYYSETATYSFTVPKEETPVVMPAVPDKPVLNVSATSTTGKYLVEWSAVQGAEFYSYEVSEYSNFSKIKSSSTKYTSCGIYVTNVAAGKTYYVRVRSGAKINGQNSYSDYAYAEVTRPANTTTVTPPASTQTVTTLTAPSGVTFKKSTTSIYKLAWSKVSGAKKYEYVAASDANYNNILKSSTTSSSSASISGLKNVSTVYVKIRAIASDGSCSDWTVLTFNK